MRVMNDMKVWGRAAGYIMIVAVACGLCLSAAAQEAWLVSQNEPARDEWEDVNGTGTVYETITSAVNAAFAAGGDVLILVDNKGISEETGEEDADGNDIWTDPAPPPIIFRESLEFSCDSLAGSSLDLTISAIPDSTIGDIVVRSGASGATEPTVVFRPSSGISSESLKVTIDGFVIEGGDGGGIRVDGGSCAELIVNGCIIQPESTGIVEGVVTRGNTLCTLINSVVRDWGEGGVRAEETAALNVYNSTVYSNTGDGIEVRDDSTVEVHGTIVYDNDGFGINCDETAASNITLSYNDVAANTEGDYQRCTPDANSISEDPGFLAGDYHLSDIAPISPCIDSNININVDLLPYSSLDIDDDIRPLTLIGVSPTNFDIGADEAGTTDPCTICITGITPNPVGIVGRGEMSIEMVNSSEIQDVWMEREDGADIINFGRSSVPGVWTNRDSIDVNTPNGVYNVQMQCNNNLLDPSDYACLSCRSVIVDTEPPRLVPTWITDDPDEETDCSDWRNAFYVLRPLGTGPGGAGNNDTIGPNTLLGIVNRWLTQYYMPPFPPVPGTAIPAFINEEVPHDYDDFDRDGIDTWRYWFNTGAMGLSPSQLIVRMAGGAVDLPKNDGATVSAGFDIATLEGPSGRPIVRQSDIGTSPSSFTDLSLYGDPVLNAGGCTESAVEIGWTLDFVPGAEGTYKVRLIAEDRAGNVSRVEDDWVDCLWATFVWDKTPPRTEITDGCFPELHGRQATFLYGLADGPASAYVHVLERYRERTRQGRYSFGTPPTMAWSSGWIPDQAPRRIADYPNLTVGSTYRFGVLGMDFAGNIDSTLRTEPPVNLCVFEVGAGGSTVDTTITGFTAATDTGILYKGSRAPAIIEVRDQNAKSIDITVNFKAVRDQARGRREGISFKYTLENPFTQTSQTGVIGPTTGVGAVPPGSNIVDVQAVPVTYTFSVFAFEDENLDGQRDANESYDRTPAVSTFVVKPRWINGSRDVGQEDDSFADPASGQPFKYFREEPE